jgi:hypothetical protein
MFCNNTLTARAGHHANNVDEIALTIAGAVVWREDGDLKVMTRSGSMKNVLWVEINGQRYALSYDHAAGAIIVKHKSTQGTPLASTTECRWVTNRIKQAIAQLDKLGFTYPKTQFQVL